MPVYEYECNKCQVVHEVTQSVSEAPKTTCPTCSGPVKKIISISSFQLKGGGWYSDGYSSASNSKPASKKPSSSSSTAPASTTCPKSSGAACPCQ